MWNKVFNGKSKISQKVKNYKLCFISKYVLCHCTSVRVSISYNRYTSNNLTRPGILLSKTTKAKTFIFHLNLK